MSRSGHEARASAPSPTPTSRQINDRIVGIVQIESAGALEEADAIAATDGVDVLFVGPADLSHSLGVPGQFGNKTYLAALETVVEACRAHGKSPGILVYDVAVVPRLLELGFRFVGIGADGALVSAGAHAALAAVEGRSVRRLNARGLAAILPNVHGRTLGGADGRSGVIRAGK